MRVAVITDIHANLPALEAVLASAARRRGRGDLVPRRRASATAPSPTPAPSWSASAASVCLVGNHDLAVLGGLDIAAFSEAAAEAVEWTREQRRRAHARVPARARARRAQREGIGLFHASPRDPVWEYVLSIEQADACMEVQPERLALIGHSHVSLFFTRSRRTAGPARPAAARRSDGSTLDARRGRAGWSTPAASASRATATRAPPGWSSTPRS